MVRKLFISAQSHEIPSAVFVARNSRRTHLNVTQPGSWAIEHFHWLHQTAPLSHSLLSGKQQTDQIPLKSTEKYVQKNLIVAIFIAIAKVRTMMASKRTHQTVRTQRCNRNTFVLWCNLKDSLETKQHPLIHRTVLRMELVTEEENKNFLIKYTLYAPYGKSHCFVERMAYGQETQLNLCMYV